MSVNNDLGVLVEAGNHDEAKRLVCKGVEFLDGEYPGWEDAINLSELDLASASSCVLGQVGQWAALVEPGGLGYFAVLGEQFPDDLYGARDEFAAEHGFVVTVPAGRDLIGADEFDRRDGDGYAEFTYSGSEIAYGVLDAAWRSLVEARRDGDEFDCDEVTV